MLSQRQRNEIQQEMVDETSARNRARLVLQIGVGKLIDAERAGVPELEIRQLEFQIVDAVLATVCATDFGRIAAGPEADCRPRADRPADEDFYQPGALGLEGGGER